MFNEEDDRLARNVCVIGTGVRDALFGSPEEIGREIIPLGEFVNISNQRFRIIGMFEHYQSALDLKARKADKEGPEKPAPSGPKRRAGGGTPQGRGGYFEWKNKTIFIPLNTMWLRFRAGAGQDGTSDPRLSSLEFMVIDMEQIESVVIAIMGGVAGLLASKGLVNVLALLSPGDDTPVITVNAMLLGFSFSVCVGILAGLIPAFKAARLHPIQALRYE